MLDVFKSDLFSTMSLTAAIQEVPYVPRRLQELGWFDEEGIRDTTVVIEKDNNTLALVEDRPRGSNPMVVSSDKREGIPFRTTHLPETATIMADEVIGVREFGSEDGRRTVESVVAKRLEKMRRNLDATHEWHRIGAIKGLILDANGTNVIANLFERFGMQPIMLDMNLDADATPVRSRCLDILEGVEKELGSWPFSGVRVLCGKEFWRSLITHPKVEDTYLNHAAAAELRGDVRDAFEFGGLIWERYRGYVSGQAYIGDHEAYACPEGVPDLYISRFAPADYIYAVGTIGLPYYAMSEPLPMNKGVRLEAQSNPIHLVTRPRAIIHLHRTKWNQ